MQKKKIAAALMLAGFVAAATAPVFAEDAASAGDKTVIATVANQPIYQSELDSTVKALSAQFGNAPKEQLEGIALSSLIDMKLVNQAAEAEDLDKTPEFQARLAEARQQELYNEYYDEHIASAVTDDMVKARYDQEIAALPKVQEAHVRQILVSSEDQAKDVIKKLDDGGDFAKLAEQFSTGPAAKSGGDLGYLSEGQMDPDLEKAAFALKAGSYTEDAVKTDDGYHILEVEEFRDKAPASFDDVAPQIRQMVVRDEYRNQLDQMKKDGTVVIKDKGLQADYDAVNKDQQS
ncbi:peptidylprolyl isomerase [Martelella endophytica]|uniref:Parvulin-like PPIase n=1 Tax=Martelella endophytica TaxID=1486262 RepID=A0A0D5LPN6_MAREN|nr:peptidylprolyl isomerase [Martelella endophytica]AJY45732.1 peptidylprolyl isomerase [Martelella endophytica]